MRVGAISLDGESLVKACHGIIQLPQFFEHIAQVIMRLGVIGVNGQSLADQTNSNFVLTLLVGDHT